MARLLPSSARRRRRVLRLGAALWVAGCIALVIALVPGHSGRTVQHFVPGAPQLVKTERQVPVRPADRRAINTLLDRFVRDAVDRRAPLAAYRLSTPALRASAPRSAWAKGEIAVYPLRVEGSTFHDWTVAYSYRDEVNLELVVHGKPGQQFSGIDYSVDVKRIGGRWLVDSFATRGFYGPRATPASASSRHKAPGAPAAAPAAALQKGHSGIWLLVPLILFAVPALILAGWVLLAWRRRRLAERRFRLAG
jgi:hypothetical protein